MQSTDSSENKKDGNKDIPFIRADPEKMKRSKEDSLRMPEVVEALKETAKDTSWMDENFVGKLTSDPFMVKALSDPRVQIAMKELAEDPKKAMAKYAGNPHFETFIKKYLAIMGQHFENLGEKEAQRKNMKPPPTKEEVQAALQKGKGEVEFGDRKVEAKTLQDWMRNPQIMQVLNDPQTLNMIQEIKSDETAWEKYKKLPSFRLLVEAGILMKPPGYK